MKPAIGRIVHYKDSDGYTRAAVISSIYNDDRLNLTIFTDDPKKPIEFAQYVQMGTGLFQWSWPEKV